MRSIVVVPARANVLWRSLPVILWSVLLWSCAHVTAPAATRPMKRGSLQALAHGYWELTAGGQEAGVAWIALQAGDSDAMTLVWPTGLGCGHEAARVAGRQVIAVGEGFPAVVSIVNSRTAILSFRGGRSEYKLRKTRRDARVICE